MKRILVAGGGIAGLTAAWRLRQAGHDVTAWEAAGEPGGAIQTARQGGYLFEAGPTSFLGSAEHLWELCDELGLDDQVLAARPEAKRRYIVRDGRLQALPTGPISAITSPVLSLRAKLRVLREPWRPAFYDPDESVYDFVTRRFGEEIACYLADPFVGGIYAGDSRQLAVADVFPALVRFEQQYGSVIGGALLARRQGPRKRPRRRGLFSFRDGLATLTRALADRLGDTLYLNQRLARLSPRPGGGWLAEPGRGPEEAFDEVLLGMPAYAAADLVAGGAPALGEELAAIPYAPVAVVALGAGRAQVAHPLDGFGFLVPRNQGRDLLGCVWSSSAFAGRAPDGKVALSVYLGGACAPDLPALNDEALLALVQRELADLIGLAGDPEVTRIFRHPRAIPQYVKGHGQRLARVRQELIVHPGLHLIGNYLEGVSMDAAVGQAMQVAAAVAATPAAAPRPLATANP